MHNKVMGRTQTGFTEVYAQSLSADCVLDLWPSDLVLVRDISSCHDDRLCQIIFKSHYVWLSYGLDTILEYTNTHTHTDKVNSICPSAISWRGHKNDISYTYEHLKFHAQLSWAWKLFYNPVAWTQFYYMPSAYIICCHYVTRSVHMQDNLPDNALRIKQLVIKTLKVRGQSHANIMVTTTASSTFIQAS